MSQSEQAAQKFIDDWLPRGYQPMVRRLAEAIDAAIAQAVREERERWIDCEQTLRTQLQRADGALADAETVQTGDIERGIRQLTNERDGLALAYQEAANLRTQLHAAEQVVEVLREKLAYEGYHEPPKGNEKWCPRCLPILDHRTARPTP